MASVHKLDLIDVFTSDIDFTIFCSLEAGLIPFSSESTPGSATWSGHSGIFGTMSDDRLKRMVCFSVTSL